MEKCQYFSASSLFFVIMLILRLIACTKEPYKVLVTQYTWSSRIRTLTNMPDCINKVSFYRIEWPAIKVGFHQLSSRLAFRIYFLRYVFTFAYASVSITKPWNSSARSLSSGNNILDWQLLMLPIPIASLCFIAVFFLHTHASKNWNCSFNAMYTLG